MAAVSRRAFLKSGAGIVIGLTTPVRPLVALPPGRRKTMRIAEVEGDSSDVAMVSRSPQMQRVMELARAVAQADDPVLITGESGTGKERLARFVHEHSARADGPFIALDCKAISESLLEIELFGHSRGAVTGASSGRPGLLEAASRGTLFLGDVGEIPLSMQPKLLSALEDREVHRVGERRSRPIDVRIITATHKDLLPETAAKRFREDLCDHLKGTQLAVPPLRERHKDILPLARILLAEAAAWMKKSVEEFTGPAADHLLCYQWPGNVRELANVMERAVAVAMTHRVDRGDLLQEIVYGKS